MRLRSEADARNLPSLLRSAQAKAGALCKSAASEIERLEEATGLRAKASKLVDKLWAQLLAWADANGLSGRIQQLWAASGIREWRVWASGREWLEGCAANIEKRRRAMA